MSPKHMASAQCPNNDPAFDALFSRWTDVTADTYPVWRRRTYYTVCIPVRLAIAFTVYLLRNQPWLPHVVGVVALGGIINLGSQIRRRKEAKHWWSKKYQFAISALLLVASVAIIYKKNSLPEGVLSYIIIASIVGGLLQSFVYASC